MRALGLSGTGEQKDRSALSSLESAHTSKPATPDADWEAHQPPDRCVCVCVVGGGGGGGGVRGPETLAFPLRTMRGRTGICAVVALEIPVLEPEVALIFGLESHSVEAHSSQFLLREREEPSFSMTSDLFQVPSQIPMN